MKILGVIPAREGSKGIKKKNIKLLNGKPLIAYSIEQALASKLDKVVVSTNSADVMSICKSYNIDYIKRPEDLALDDSMMLPVLKHALENVEKSYEAVMTIQPTSPLRTSKHIDEAIKIFSEDLSATSLVSVTKLPHNCAPEKIMKLNGKYLSGNSNIRRRQDIGNYYVRNGAAIYITNKDLLDRALFDEKVLPYYMSKIESIDIDDLEDWQIVESLIKIASFKV